MTLSLEGQNGEAYNAVRVVCDGWACEYRGVEGLHGFMLASQQDFLLVACEAILLCSPTLYRCLGGVRMLAHNIMGASQQMNLRMHAEQFTCSFDASKWQGFIRGSQSGHMLEDRYASLKVSMS